MSKYTNRVIGAGEQVLYEAQIHWYVYLRGIVFVVLGMIVGCFGEPVLKYGIGNTLGTKLDIIVRVVSLAIIAYGALNLLYGYIKQISTELILTNRRIIAKYGFVAVTSYEIMITKMEGATIDQTIWGRMLGFGTIYVKGTGGGISPVDHIANPYTFHNHLMHAIEMYQNGTPQQPVFISTPPQMPPSSQDVPFAVPEIEDRR